MPSGKHVGRTPSQTVSGVNDDARNTRPVGSKATGTYHKLPTWNAPAVSAELATRSGKAAPPADRRSSPSRLPDSAQVRPSPVKSGAVSMCGQTRLMRGNASVVRWKRFGKPVALPDLASGQATDSPCGAWVSSGDIYL